MTPSQAAMDRARELLLSMDFMSESPHDVNVLATALDEVAQERDAALQKVIGHSNCYCDECQQAARRHWTPKIDPVRGRREEVEALRAEVAGLKEALEVYAQKYGREAIESDNLRSRLARYEAVVRSVRQKCEWYARVHMGPDLEVHHALKVEIPAELAALDEKEGDRES